MKKEHIVAVTGVHSDTDRQIVKICEAYNKQDYRKSTELAQTLIQEVPNLTVVQILLISLQRLGRIDEVEQIAPKLLASLSDITWTVWLLEITLGLRSGEEVLKYAKHSIHQCQAMYYTGERLATLGKSDAARLAFETVAKTGLQCNQVVLANAALQNPWKGANR